MKTNLTIFSSLAVILVLIIPIFAINYAQEQAIENIIEGNYVTVGYSYPALINGTAVNNTFSIGPPLDYYVANPNTVLINGPNVWIGFTKDAISYVNNTILVNTNYGIIDGPLLPSSFFIVGINLTGNDLLNLDFLILESNDLHNAQISLVLNYDGEVDFIHFDDTINGNPIILLTEDIKNEIRNEVNLDDVVYISWEPLDWNENIWVFSISHNTFTYSSIFLDEITITALSLLGSIAILSITIAFNTDTLDIFIDKKKHGWKK